MWVSTGTMPDHSPLSSRMAFLSSTEGEGMEETNGLNRHNMRVPSAKGGDAAYICTVL